MKLGENNYLIINHFDQVSLGLDKRCEFFTNSPFLNVGPFFDQDFITFASTKIDCISL